jgi:hypothetical protein
MTGPELYVSISLIYNKFHQKRKVILRMKTVRLIE